MLLNLRKSATAAVAALSLAAAVPAPAFAWGEKEQNALAALIAAGVVGTIILKENNRRHAAPVARAPVPSVPAYYPPTSQPPRYTPPYQSLPQAPSGLYATPAARAFNSYSASQRRSIQARLANAGYYHGGIDGAFGPQTYRAVLAIAGDSSGTDQMETMAGAYEFYDAILG